MRNRKHNEETMKQNSRRVIEVFPAIVLVLAVSLFAGCAAEKSVFEEEQTFTDIEKLEVVGSFFEVDVVGGSQRTVETKVTIPERIRRRGVSVNLDRSGSTLVVTVQGRGRGSGFLSFEQPRLSIGVPIGTAIKLETSSGSISVDGVVTDSMDLSASSGKIDILNSDATISVRTSSGKIAIDSSNGQKELRSTSGGISVEQSDGDTKSDSSSGKQIYKEIRGLIIATSTSGKIEISEINGALELHSGSGNLQGSGVTLSGNSSFQTSSGSIDIDFTNDLDEFTLDLESSSGKINAGRTSARGVVVTGSGGIHVRGESTSGRQTYK